MMYKKILILTLGMWAMVTHAQVGIGTESPDKSSALEIKFDKRGLLIPRVKLRTTDDPHPITDPANSLLVYNTTASGTVIATQVIPGYYYWTTSGTTGYWNKLFTYSDALGLKYTAGVGIEIGSGVISATGLERLDKVKPSSYSSHYPNPYYAWRLIGRNEATYLDTGYASIDLSFSQNNGYKKTGASGDFSITTGYRTTASDRYSTAMGAYTTASGYASTAIGHKTTASGGYSTAMGDDTAATGDWTTTMGKGTIAKGHFSTAMGTYNTDEINAYTKTSTSVEPNNMSEYNRLLVVGNGSGTSLGGKQIRSDVFTILKGGQVGIDIDNFEDTYISSKGNGYGRLTDMNAKLQVNGLVQSRGILNATDNSATKVVVASSDGVLKTIDKSSLGNKYTAGAGIEISGGVISATGLESIPKADPYSYSGYPNSYYAWRLIGRNESKYLDPGYGAIDLSFNNNNNSIKTGASGNFSVAMGRETQATGHASTAMGRETQATGQDSAAMGYTTQATGSSSTAMGYGTLAKGNHSTSMGLSTQAIGSYSTSMGLSTQANGDSSIAMGKYNKPNNKNIFSLGIGASTANTANALVVDYSGRVAIGKETPDTSTSAGKLQVNGLIQSEGINSADGSTAAKVVVADNNGVLKTIDKSSLSSISSDRRLKKDIQTLPATATSLLAQLRPVQYHWNSVNGANTDTQTLQYGFIAQEVLPLFPNLVQKNEVTSYYSMNYTGLIPVLTQALQEKSAEIEELKAKLAQQQSQLEQQEQNYKNLEARIRALEK